MDMAIYMLMSIALFRAVECKAPPALIVFGDSLVDSGNNDYIPSIARSNFRPYGIDFPGKQPTGRFSNGRIISDFLSESWEMEPILPFLDPNAKGQNLLRGINFASAGAGILNDTGVVFISRLRQSQQVQFFSEYQDQLKQLIGESAAASLVSGALYSITTGSNDYINNYLLPGSIRSRQFTASQFQDLLISTFREQLMEIYEMGARKFVVTGIGPIGCIPSQLAQRGRNMGGRCLGRINQLAINFNNALEAILAELNQELPGAIFLYSNAFGMVSEYINNPAPYGIQVVNRGCCGQGAFNGLGTCTRLSNLCPDRNVYVFWDPFHPTDFVNKLITQRVLNGPPSDISPINLNQLLARG